MNAGSGRRCLEYDLVGRFCSRLGRAGFWLELCVGFHDGRLERPFYHYNYLNAADRFWNMEQGVNNNNSSWNFDVNEPQTLTPELTKAGRTNKVRVSPLSLRILFAFLCFVGSASPPHHFQSLLLSSIKLGVNINNHPVLSQDPAKAVPHWAMIIGNAENDDLGDEFKFQPL